MVHCLRSRLSLCQEFQKFVQKIVGLFSVTKTKTWFNNPIHVFSAGQGQNLCKGLQNFNFISADLQAEICLIILGRNLEVPVIVGGCLENSSSFLESFGGFLGLSSSSSLLRRLLKGGGFYFYDSGPPHTLVRLAWIMQYYIPTGLVQLQSANALW